MRIRVFGQQDHSLPAADADSPQEIVRRLEMDRIAGAGMHSVLEFHFDLDFTESNFGPRWGKSPHQASWHLQRQVQAGKEWAVAVDLKAFFSGPGAAGGH